MHQSNTLNYIVLKYVTLAFGAYLLLMTLLLLFDPTFDVTVNGVKRPAEPGDSLFTLIPAIFLLLLYLVYGRRVVKMQISRNEFVFTTGGQEQTRAWKEVEEVKRYWLVAPPVYSVTFEDGETYYFNSGLFFIVTPFYVFDLSEMGRFIMKRRKDIALIKA